MLLFLAHYFSDGASIFDLIILMKLLPGELLTKMTGFAMETPQ